MSKYSKDSNEWVPMVILVLVLVAGTIGLRWYTSAVQASVWQREGVELTTWEVFCGAKPSERVISIKK